MHLLLALAAILHFGSIQGKNEEISHYELSKLLSLLSVSLLARY